MAEGGAEEVWRKIRLVGRTRLRSVPCRFSFHTCNVSSSCVQKPFLDGVSHLSEDVASVLPAADSLEQYLLDLIGTVSEEGEDNVYEQQLVRYQVYSSPFLGGVIRNEKHGSTIMGYVQADL